MPSDTIAAPASARALFRHGPFMCFSLGRVFSTLAYQMGAVAVGWQVYALTHSPFDLGMVGLWQFIPNAVLTFAAGHAADRYARKQVLQLCQIAEAMVAAFLAWGTFGHWLNVHEIFVAVVVYGAARAFGNPASAAMLPGVVPEGLLQKGTALSSGALQFSTIAGPAIGGFAGARRALCPDGSIVDHRLPAERRDPDGPPGRAEDAAHFGVTLCRRRLRPAESRHPRHHFA
jgi:MFS family permease